LVAQLQFHEQLVVTLALLLLELLLVQQVQVQLVQQVQVLLVQPVLQLFAEPLESVEHPCLPKTIGVSKNLWQQENLAY
jgi:hypothetical protein